MKASKIGTITPEREKLFWSKVEKSKGCWNWIGKTDRYGYGTFSVNGTRRLAHRIAWKLHYGSLKTSDDVLHKCDNPACVKPTHLKLGSHQENMRDRNLRHRNALGASHGKAILDDEKVLAIRFLHYVGASTSRLAAIFSISQNHVSNIVSRKYWKHI